MSEGLEVENNNSKPIIVALDYADIDSALNLVDKLDPQKCRLKIGKQLFTLGGPQLVQTLVNQSFDVFLDLKFHDIPVTVANACHSAADLGVWMVNVHASGGLRMMKAAREAIPLGSGGPVLVAVSVLTSMDKNDLREIGIEKSVEEQVLCLSHLANEAGLDGMVCSAEEASLLRSKFGNNFILVTPGIRLADSNHDDQCRVTTPTVAMSNGADFLVIGRPITGSEDPLRTLTEINKELGVS